MKTGEKLLCVAYGTIAAVALFATWIPNLAFFSSPDNGGVMGFIRGGYVNPASTSMTNDLLLYALAGVIFMLAEGRRLRMRYVAVYVVIALGVAISVAFPLFLIARQRRLVAGGPAGW